jgi:hypothetical protein
MRADGFGGGRAPPCALLNDSSIMPVKQNMEKNRAVFRIYGLNLGI